MNTRSILRIRTTAIALALAGSIGGLLGALPTNASARPVVIVQPAPPPVRVEVAPPPRDGRAWDPGHWRWTGRQYVWVPGHWRPAVVGAHWVPGAWGPRGRGWGWTEGRWVR